MTITHGYITLDEMKEYVNINPDDQEDDAVLEGCVSAACRAIDGWTGRRFYLDTNATARLYSPISATMIFTEDIGTTSGLIVKTDDGSGTFPTTLSASAYQAEPQIIDGRPITKIRLINGNYLPLNFYPGQYTVSVTAKWGWPSVPADILTATRLLATRYFKRRQSPTGLQAFQDTAAYISASDRDVRDMLARYKRYGAV